MTRSAAHLRRLAVALVATAVAATGLVAVGAGTAVASDSSMAASVNASRAAKGLPAYGWSGHLASVAAEQAKRMARKGELYHNPNLGADVGSYRWVGENVGYGPHWTAIQDAFMNSAGHRANILDKEFTQVGIASARDAKGRLWVAQVFRQPLSSTSGTTTKSTTTKKKPAGSTTTTKAAPKPTAKPKPKAAPKPAARTTTSRANADAAPERTSSPRPRPTATRTTPPAPAPTLAERVSYAQEQSGAAGADPVSDALAFAATMHAVAG